MNITLEDIITLTQRGLYSKIQMIFSKTAICKKGGYILVPGNAPILLVAHMDTLHKEPVRQICKSEDGAILMSPQGIGGDDRCGVYALLKIHHDLGPKPWLLFTCDREVGGLGARQFVCDFTKGELPENLPDLKLLIEIDGEGENGAVYYDCSNLEFETYISKRGFKTRWGTFSDMSVIAPALGVAGVSVSSGYQNSDTLYEYIDTKQLDSIIGKVKRIVTEAAGFGFRKYEYMEKTGIMTYRIPKMIHYEYSEYKKLLENVPNEYVDEYIDLLDIYTHEELDMMREENGEVMIYQLWEKEFAGR